VCYERVTDVGRVERSDALPLRGGGTPHDTGSEIHQVRLAINNDGRRRT